MGHIDRQTDGKAEIPSIQGLNKITSSVLSIYAYWTKNSCCCIPFVYTITSLRLEQAIYLHIAETQLELKQTLHTCFNNNAHCCLHLHILLWGNPTGLARTLKPLLHGAHGLSYIHEIKRKRNYIFKQLFKKKPVVELFVERDMNKMRSVLKLVFYIRNETRILFDMTLQKHIVNFVHCA